MPDFMIYDDLFAPNHEIEMKYTGPNPFSMVKRTTDIFRRHFEISGTKFTQKDTRYDYSGETRKFFIEMEMKREEDGFTNLWLDLKFQGEFHAETRVGWCRFWIYCQLMTKLEEGNLLRFLMSRIYLQLFYKQHRISLLKRNNERARMALNDVRQLFRLPVRPEA
jgi:hypothetical protein